MPGSKNKSSRSRLILSAILLLLVATVAGLVSRLNTAPTAFGQGSSIIPITDKRGPNYPPGPPRDPGGLVFNVSTVVDAQRQVGEPDVVVSPIFTPGNPTSADIYASGPWGASTEQSYAWKSTDNGDTYHAIGRIRPDIGPGGGDTSTEVDDQNFLFMTDLEALTQVASARSTDGGDTFTRNSAVSDFVGIDRQWMALDNGLSPLPTDNTEFLTYRQAAAGSFMKSALTTDPTQTFINAQANFPAAMNSGAPCGDLIFDPHDRYLYLPCGSGQQVEVARAHVDPGQRTGLVFTSTLTPAGVGDVSNLFPVLATDTAGNVYVTYVDDADFNVYLTYSTNHGQTWSNRLRVNGDQANTALFPWVTAGSDGRVAIAYLATDRIGDPNSFPSFFNDRAGASTVKWHLYMNYVMGANTSNPTVYQVQASDHPTHYGQVCTAGTLCVATGGDRTMADFLTIQKDNTGAARIIYNDTTNQHHGASVFEVRQIGGPSLYGTTLSGTRPTNPVTDPANDAHYPHFCITVPGCPKPNYDALDIEGVGIIEDFANITVTMTISDLNATRILPGASSVIWLTRWQALAQGDGNPPDEAYRIFYAGAKSTGGGAPTFFYGTTTADDTSAVGCTPNSFPQNCKLLFYPQPVGGNTTGTFDPATGVIKITVPRNAFQGLTNGSTLYSVTGLTLGTRDTATDFYDDVDAAKAFNITLASGPSPTPTSSPTITTTPTHTATAVPTPCSPSTLLSEGFESGTYGVFTATTTLGTLPWVITNTLSSSGTYSAHVDNPNETSDQMMEMVSTVTVPAGATQAQLRFKHTFSFESPDFDGGVLEYTTNGTLWLNADALIIEGGYNGTITGAPSLAGQPGWVNQSAGYPAFRQVTVDLMSLLGQNVRFRFREASDVNGPAPGWWVDDVSILVSQGACPTTTAVSASPTPANTATRVPTVTLPTQTPGGPTATPEPPSPTATVCPLTFSDVQPDNIFYPFIRCLACRGIMSGYPCGGPGEPCDGNANPYFRPYNDITRGQIAKIVSNSAGFDEDPGPQLYEDVPPGSPFYAWINRLSMRGHMGGYPCGLVPQEPCIEPDNRPYFRPTSSATRGQLAKIVSNAAGIESEPQGQFYTDVPEDNPFYLWIMRLTDQGVMSGYECGGPGEPCDDQNRPYFRPFANVTRAQASKIVANTFYPGCQTPSVR